MLLGGTMAVGLCMLMGVLANPIPPTIPISRAIEQSWLPPVTAAPPPQSVPQTPEAPVIDADPAPLAVPTLPMPAKPQTIAIHLSPPVPVVAASIGPLDLHMPIAQEQVPVPGIRIAPWLVRGQPVDAHLTLHLTLNVAGDGSVEDIALDRAISNHPDPDFVSLWIDHTLSQSANWRVTNKNNAATVRLVVERRIGERPTAHFMGSRKNLTLNASY